MAVLPSGLNTCPAGTIDWNAKYNANFELLDDQLQNYIVKKNGGTSGNVGIYHADNDAQADLHIKLNSEPITVLLESTNNDPVLRFKQSYTSDIALRRTDGTKPNRLVVYAGDKDTGVPSIIVVQGGTNAGNVGIGVEDPRAKLHATVSTILGCAPSPAQDTDLNNNEVNIWHDESTNKLKFKVKYSDGTVKNGELALL